MNFTENSFADLRTLLEFAYRDALYKGRKYFQDGRVLRIEQLDAGKRFEIAVRGSEVYNVTLKWSRRGWSGQCTCPIGSDCKHIVAAALALEAEAVVEGVEAKVPRRKSASAAAVQPPSSPLSSRLTTRLGRDLNEEEADYVRLVQSAYSGMQSGEIAQRSLELLAERNPGFGWNAVQIAPSRPENDFKFWLHVAWELRKRQWPIPIFMQGITDLTLIEPAMTRWVREKEISKWRQWLRNFAGDEIDARGTWLELRLLMLPDEARLQWRRDPESAFVDFRQSDAKKFSEQFAGGHLAIEADSLPIWSALNSPWHYESWWSFKYAHGTARTPLNRVLRMPLAPERVVTGDGQPMRRATEPLRFELREPSDADATYELSLVRADGSPPPKIICTLGGRPTLYLTEEGLFEGPSSEALESDRQKQIPAAALESAEGVRFLKSSGVPLPARIQERLRTVPLKVTIQCKLESPYQYSTGENIYVKITANAERRDPEYYSVNGWQRDRGPQRKAKPHIGEEILFYDRAAQAHFPRVIESLGLKWDVYQGFWYLRLTKKIPELFVNWLKSLPPEIEVLLDKELATLRDEPVSGTISLDVSEAGIDWFDLKVALNVGDTTLTPEELKLLLNARGGYVRLGKKGWRKLQFDLTAEDDQQLARLGLNPRDLSAEPQRFHALQLADEAAKKFLAAEQVERIQRRVSELKMRVVPALPSDLRVEMRPYQTEGFHFLAYLSANRFGGVLADDMGLGKTIQALAWLAWLRNENSAPLCSLVVCPKSVMDNWRGEAERFYPNLRVRVWRGELAGQLNAARTEADLIVINYSQLRALMPAIAAAAWLAVILDEAQYIKNPDSQTAQAARALQADHRLALTGTPIENRLLDLWSIFAFAMPGALGNRSHFLKRFDAKDDPLARRRLAARVRPFLLRRTKSQVAKDLPDRIEEDLLCELEAEQKTLYRAELKRARQIILGLKTNKQLNDQRFNILTSLLRLRQICCHPALIDKTLRDAESAKVAALEDLLEPLMEEGHKTLVFSQFVTMLDLLCDKAKERGWRHFYLGGDTENRGELVKEFQSTTGSAVFFISLKAGGFGLNLTAASYVVLFDPWWNPAVENQAIDRTHRIGQSSKVIAYRLLMRDSIEQKIRALQKQKSSLAEDVLGEERFAQSLTLDDLKFLFAN